MKLPLSIHIDEQEESVCQNLGIQVQLMWDQVRKWSDRQIDGFNLDENLLGDGLHFGTFSSSSPGKIVNSLADTTSTVYIERKGDGAATETYYGINIFVDASSATGTLCIVDSNDSNEQQLLTFDPEPYTNTNPGAEIRSPLGALTLDTGGAFNLILQRNNITQLTFGGTNITSNDRHLVATTTNTADLGTSSVGWRAVYTRVIDTDGNNNLFIRHNGTDIIEHTDTNLDYDGYDGTVLFRTRNTASHCLVFWTLSSPNTNTLDLGTSSLAWRELYVRNIDTDGDNDLIIQRNNVTRITVTSSDADFAGAVDSNVSFKIGGTKVIGEQGTAVADASGGATIDAEARTAINTLLARIRAHGLIAT